MRLERAEQRGDCKLWVTHQEYEVMQRVAATGGAVILPDVVVQHLRLHRHEMVAEFAATAGRLVGIAVHLLPYTPEELVWPGAAG